jgi:hypothetical protein
LSKDAEDLLARARAVPPLARERQLKVRAALLGQIALLPATGAAAGALAKMGLAKVLLAVSAACVVGAAAVVAARNGDTAPLPAERAPMTLGAPAAPAELAPVPAVDESAESPPQVEPSVRHAVIPPVSPKAEARAPAKKTDPSEPVARSAAPAPIDHDTLREEIDLVQKANSALRSGKPDQAQALLDRHRERFASGALREEREAARILALCALGKQSEARAAAARFLRESPRSMQAARVRGSCALKGSPKAR